MSLNGYSYVEGNTPNRTDPTGRCPENPAWYDVIGWRCKHLAQHFANKYDLNLDKLMKLQYHQLEAFTALETLNNAAILPRLFQEHPELARQAVMQWACQNNVPQQVATAIGLTLVVSVTAGGTIGAGGLAGGATGAATGTGAALGGGALLGMGGLIAGIVVILATAGTIADTSQSDEECTRESVERLSEGRTVADVVYGSALSDRINGRRIKSAEPKRLARIGPESVTEFAYRAKCQGSPFPPVPLIRGVNFDTLRDGHHRFVASRLVNIPIGAGYIDFNLNDAWDDPWTDFDDPGYDIGVNDVTPFDFDDAGDYLAFEWSEVQW